MKISYGKADVFFPSGNLYIIQIVFFKWCYSDDMDTTVNSILRPERSEPRGSWWDGSPGRSPYEGQEGSH
jgi:hypothetical protein